MRFGKLIAISFLFCVVIFAQQGRGRGPGIPAPLKITISGFSDGGAIPATYGCVGGKNGNVSPGVQWSGAPEGVQSIALIMHDTDLQFGAEDVLHWAIFNIPSSATGLPENVPTKATLDDGSVQLTNIGRGQGYFNPCPPPPTVHPTSLRFTLWMRSSTLPSRIVPTC